MSLVCLSLLGAPALEEKLLDHLLQSPHDLTFTSQVCASHGGHSHHSLDVSEQVLGRARAVLVQVLIPETVSRQLLADLSASFSGSGLRYWVTPVLQEGEC